MRFPNFPKVTGIPVALGLVALVYFAYWSIINNTFVSDDFYLAEQATGLSLSDPLGFLKILAPAFVRPVPMLIWWGQIQVFGTSGTAAHVINVGLHAGNACLLCWLVVRLGASRLAAVTAAGLFAVMPVGPEAVTWLAGRFDLTALLFTLLALILYTFYLEKESRPAMIASLACGGLALLSKEEAMILVVLYPALELLYGPQARQYQALTGPAGAGRLLHQKALAPSVRQLIHRPAIVIYSCFFAAFMLLRFPLIGKMGGYKPFLGIPRPRGMANSLLTLLAPLNDLLFSRTEILLYAAFTGSVAMFALISVAWYWRRAPSRLRRLWMFLAVFGIASVGPVFWGIMVEGLSTDLKDSRWLYFPAAAVLPMATVALLDFLPRRRFLRPALALMFAALMTINIYLLNINNSLWEDSAAIAWSVPEQTRRQLPDPPQGTSIYYRGLPSWIGVWSFGYDIEPAIWQGYGRRDLHVMRVGPEASQGVVPASDAGDGYLFAYDTATGILTMERGPLQ